MTQDALKRQVVLVGTDADSQEAKALREAGFEVKVVRPMGYEDYAAIAQDTIELEHAKDELECVNHELQASNEELQNETAYRRQAEEKLQRLNRTLRAHNRSAKAMMRATEESEYMQEVCEIIVEDCGHAMVWIGFAADDEAKSVIPVAYSGFEAGYLETLGLSWADTERGRGPTGTAIRTGKPSTCRNMLTDPQFAPWREQAIKRGYASSIVLPLLTDDKAFGAITIYSREPDPFSDDEVRLLAGLADDLAYGISAIRLQIAKAEVEEALRESEMHVRLKLDSILSPEGDIGNLELGDIIDSKSIQSLMESFYQLARIPMAIIDLKGKVLVGVGWAAICTKFHRVHAETCKHCIESDTELTAGVAPGEFKLYKCKNNMWDISTPIIVGGKHVGNLFSGQFFFDDEPLDYGLFRSQAERYGFPEDEYIRALENVTRLSRESLHEGMTFFVKLADKISRLSYSNIKLAGSLAERDRLMESVLASEEELERRRALLAAVADNTKAQLVYLDRDFNFIWVNQAYAASCGRPEKEFVGHNHFEFYPHEENQAIFERVRDTGIPFETKEKPFVFPDHPERGTTYWDWTLTPITDGEGCVQNLVFSLLDVTNDVLARREIARLGDEAAEKASQLELSLSRESRIAQALQEAIIPQGVSSQMLEYRIAARYRPALEEADIGGDFYDVFDLGGGRFGVLIGDVAGKGLPAAIRVAAARHAIRSYAYIDDSPGRVLELSNNALCKDVGPEDVNMLTALFAVADTNAGTLVYACAGHEPPVFCGPNTECEEIESGGLPLGVMPGASYPEVSRNIKPGDTIMMVTDGIIEARMKGSGLFGRYRVFELLSQDLERSPDEIASDLMNAATEFAGGRLQDDAALVVMRYEPNEQVEN